MLGYISWVSYIGQTNWPNAVELATGHGGHPRATLQASYRFTLLACESNNNKVIRLGVKAVPSVTVCVMHQVLGATWRVSPGRWKIYYDD